MKIEYPYSYQEIAKRQARALNSTSSISSIPPFTQSNALTGADFASHIHKGSLCGMSYPQFFQQPFRYLRWASHEKPAIFYSFVIASGGPLVLFIAPPIRRYFNDGPREKIPLTYPSKLYTRGDQSAKVHSLAKMTDRANLSIL